MNSLHLQRSFALSSLCRSSLIIGDPYSRRHCRRPRQHFSLLRVVGVVAQSRMEEALEKLRAEGLGSELALLDRDDLESLLEENPGLRGGLALLRDGEAREMTPPARPLCYGSVSHSFIRELRSQAVGHRAGVQGGWELPPLLINEAYTELRCRRGDSPGGESQRHPQTHASSGFLRDSRLVPGGQGPREWPRAQRSLPDHP